MRTSVCWLVLPCVFAAAQASAALFGDDVARKGVAEQQKRIDGLAARYDELAARFAKLEDAVKAQSSSGSQSVLDLAGQVQALRDELRSMRGQIETVSFGEEKPRSQGANEQAWAENRRADIVYQGE